jgi:hypothetical protein
MWQRASPVFYSIHTYALIVKIQEYANKSQHNVRAIKTQKIWHVSTLSFCHPQGV